MCSFHLGSIQTHLPSVSINAGASLNHNSNIDKTLQFGIHGGHTFESNANAGYAHNLDFHQNFDKNVNLGLSQKHKHHVDSSSTSEYGHHHHHHTENGLSESYNHQHSGHIGVDHQNGTVI